MRLNQKTRFGLIFVVVAVIVIAAAMKFGKNQATDQNPEATPVPTTTVVMTPGNQVAVARIDIPARTVITKDMLVMQDGNRYGSESDRNDRFATDPALIEGYVTNKIIPRDKPIDRRADVVGHINDVGVGALVNPGFRAMFVPIANKATLHNLVKVGDYVDIIAGFEGLESKTIVQNKRVLAVDVFVDAFPPRSIARSGDYKAAPRGDAAPPPPPPGPNGQPAAPGAPAPTPTPAPGNGQPVPAPEAALTLEVTPEDVVALNLSVNSNALLDYVIRPRDAGTAVPEVRVAAITKARLAPAAYRGKTAAPAPAAKAVATDRGSRPSNNWSSPAPPTNWVNPTTPVNPGTLEPVKPPTYDIPIYGDGKMVRVDTVRKPEGGY